MQIISAEPLLSPIIRKIAENTWPDTYHFLPDGMVNYMLQQFYGEEVLKDLMSRKEQLFYLLENHKGFYAISVLEDGSWKLNKLYLEEVCKGMGLGKALLLHAEAQVKERGGETLVLNVNRFNPTLKFYSKHGYRITEEVNIPVGPYFMNDYVMKKNLE